MTKIIFFSFFLVGCSSSSHLAINTTPEKADILAYNQRTNKFEQLGKTPLTLDGEKVKDITSLRVEKKGYVSENILLPDDPLKNIQIHFDLKENHKWISEESKSISKIAEDIATSIHQINRHTNSRDYSSALTLINKLVHSYPKTFIFYDIRGSILLLMDRKEEARRNFRKSLEINPGNLKTKSLLEKI